MPTISDLLNKIYISETELELQGLLRSVLDNDQFIIGAITFLKSDENKKDMVKFLKEKTKTQQEVVDYVSILNKKYHNENPS